MHFGTAAVVAGEQQSVSRTVMVLEIDSLSLALSLRQLLFLHNTNLFIRISLRVEMKSGVLCIFI